MQNQISSPGQETVPEIQEARKYPERNGFTPRSRAARQRASAVGSPEMRACTCVSADDGRLFEAAKDVGATSPALFPDRRGERRAASSPRLQRRSSGSDAFSRPDDQPRRRRGVRRLPRIGRPRCGRAPVRAQPYAAIRGARGASPASSIACARRRASGWLVRAFALASVWSAFFALRMRVRGAAHAIRKSVISRVTGRAVFFRRAVRADTRRASFCVGFFLRGAGLGVRRGRGKRSFQRACYNRCRWIGQEVW